MEKGTRTITPDEIAAQRRWIADIREMLPSGSAAGILTFGCQQNVADSQRIAGMMREMGYEITDDLTKCDLIVVNTCAIREHAELKALSRTGQLKHLKAANPRLKIGLCGCMIQQKHRIDDIREKYPYVDFIFGTHMIHRFPEVLYNALSTSKRQISIDQSDGYIAEGIALRRESSYQAFVNIMLGCDNYCTYCVVPYVRGRQRSRRREDIIAEVRGLIESGYREITLLGQNVNSYGLDLPEGERVDFASLIEEVAVIEGDFWVRFMTSHPKDVPDRLIDVIAANEKIERHFHLPLQSGDNRILGLMNRRYTREYYMEIVRKLRGKVGKIALTTDIITGFPSESEEEFERTLKMVDEVGYDNIFSFIFSERKGTPAYSMEGKLPYAVKQARHARLLELHHRRMLEINKSYAGQRLRALVEGKSSKGERIYTARTSTNKLVNFTCERDFTGEFVTVEITKAGLHALSGKIIM